MWTRVFHSEQNARDFSMTRSSGSQTKTWNSDCREWGVGVGDNWIQPSRLQKERCKKNLSNQGKQSSVVGTEKDLDTAHWTALPRVNLLG